MPFFQPVKDKGYSQDQEYPQNDFQEVTAHIVGCELVFFFFFPSRFIFYFFWLGIKKIVMDSNIHAFSVPHEVIYNNGPLPDLIRAKGKDSVLIGKPLLKFFFLFLEKDLHIDMCYGAAALIFRFYKYAWVFFPLHKLDTVS